MEDKIDINPGSKGIESSQKQQKNIATENEYTEETLDCSVSMKTATKIKLKKQPKKYPVSKEISLINCPPEFNMPNYSPLTLTVDPFTKNANKNILALSFQNRFSLLLRIFEVNESTIKLHSSHEIKSSKSTLIGYLNQDFVHYNTFLKELVLIDSSWDLKRIRIKKEITDEFKEKISVEYSNHRYYRQAIKIDSDVKYSKFLEFHQSRLSRKIFFAGLQIEHYEFTDLDLINLIVERPVVIEELNCRKTDFNKGERMRFLIHHSFNHKRVTTQAQRFVDELGLDDDFVSKVDSARVDFFKYDAKLTLVVKYLNSSSMLCLLDPRLFKIIQRTEIYIFDLAGDYIKKQGWKLGVYDSIRIEKIYFCSESSSLLYSIEIGYSRILIKIQLGLGGLRTPKIMQDLAEISVSQTENFDLDVDFLSFSKKQLFLTSRGARTENSEELIGAQLFLVNLEDFGVSPLEGFGQPRDSLESYPWEFIERKDRMEIVKLGRDYSSDLLLMTNCRGAVIVKLKDKTCEMVSGTSFNYRTNAVALKNQMKIMTEVLEDKKLILRLFEVGFYLIKIGKNQDKEQEIDLIRYYKFDNILGERSMYSRHHSSMKSYSHFVSEKGDLKLFFTFENYSSIFGAFLEFDRRNLIIKHKFVKYMIGSEYPDWHKSLILGNYLILLPKSNFSDHLKKYSDRLRFSKSKQKKGKVKIYLADARLKTLDEMELVDGPDFGCSLGLENSLIVSNQNEIWLFKVQDSKFRLIKKLILRGISDFDHIRINHSNFGLCLHIKKEFQFDTIEQIIRKETRRKLGRVKRSDLRDPALEYPEFVQNDLIIVDKNLRTRESMKIESKAMFERVVAIAEDRCLAFRINQEKAETILLKKEEKKSKFVIKAFKVDLEIDDYFVADGRAFYAEIVDFSSKCRIVSTRK